MPSYREWLEAEQAHQAAEASSSPWTPEAVAEQRRLQRMVIVKLEDLEHDDDWGILRKSIEALRATEVAALAALQAQILAPEAVGDRLLVLKAEAARLAGRVSMAEDVLAIPDRWKKSLAMSPVGR
jgi:hypothetical protein